MARPDFLALISGQKGLAGLLAGGRASISGNPFALASFGGLFDRFQGDFEIVRP
jgi:alkyl sulfatase BDS1-like metallo-beta-lactamase superfamily hydrolase